MLRTKDLGLNRKSCFHFGKWKEPTDCQPLFFEHIRVKSQFKTGMPPKGYLKQIAEETNEIILYLLFQHLRDKTGCTDWFK